MCNRFFLTDLAKTCSLIYFLNQLKKYVYLKMNVIEFADYKKILESITVSPPLFNH